MDNKGISSDPLLSKEDIEEGVLYVFVFPNFFSTEKAVIDPLIMKFL